MKTELLANGGATPASANGARSSPLGSPRGLGVGVPPPPHGLGLGHGGGLAAAPDDKAYEALKALNRNLCT